MEKYVAYEASTGKVAKFESYDDAKSWLISFWKEGYMLGNVSKCFIAEITGVAMVETSEGDTHENRHHFKIGFIDL